MEKYRFLALILVVSGIVSVLLIRLTLNLAADLLQVLTI